MHTTVGKLITRKLEALGHAIFYIMLALAGQRGAYLLLVPVVFTYVLCSRRIHRRTRPYLERRFPGQGPVGRWLATYRIVLSFGQILVDRAWLGRRQGSRLQGEITGYEQLRKRAGRREGLVLLTAHVGNWQTALAHLSDLPVRVHALMHYEEEAVAKHYFDFRPEGCPFQIIRNDGFLGGMVEATAALQKGEWVTIMGDRLTKGPAVHVELLGRTVRLPAAAYILAAKTQTRIAVLLAAKTGRQRYRLQVWDMFLPAYRDRSTREQDLAAAAGRFALDLEEYLQTYPYQWFNFYDFWSQ